MTPLARSVARRTTATCSKRLPRASSERARLVPSISHRGRVKLRAASRAAEVFYQLGSLGRLSVVAVAVTIVLAFVVFSVYAWSTLL
jgi:hypothetical protein